MLNLSAHLEKQNTQKWNKRSGSNTLLKMPQSQHLVVTQCFWLWSVVLIWKQSVEGQSTGVLPHLASLCGMVTAVLPHCTEHDRRHTSMESP